MNIDENKDSESENSFEDSRNEISEEISKSDNIQHESPRNQYKKGFRHKMYVLFRELYFLLLIVLTYAAFQNSTPKVSKSPKAYPFFPKGSLVRDYYNGDLSEAIEFASQSDLAFVMYYAPWDAESHNVRQEFILTAQYMGDKIHFVAINCWQPNSECRQQYSKVYTWPVLMAYPAHGRGIQYRGIRKYEYMIKFLQFVSKPIHRITKLSDIHEYQTSHDVGSELAVVFGTVSSILGCQHFPNVTDQLSISMLPTVLSTIKYFHLIFAKLLNMYIRAHICSATSQIRKNSIRYSLAVVVGLMNVNLGSNDFGVFYSSALRFLERDPFREIQFLIFTEYVENIHLPRLELHLWNETLIYPESSDWKPESINTWISENLHQVSLWTTLPGSKSTILSNYLTPGPALILFTPRNPLYSHIDYYNVLHGVALDYYNCENNIGINLQKTYLKLLRKKHNLEYKHMENNCMQHKKNKSPNFQTVVTYDLNKIWVNNSCNSANSKPMQNFCYGKKINKHICSNVVTSEIKLNRADNMINKDANSENFVEKSDHFYADRKSPEILLKQHEKEKCYYFKLAHKIHPAIFAPLNATGSYSANISGLACNTNISLSILALDVMEYHHFAENLGIDVLKSPDKTATVILNPKLETHHVMKDGFSVESLNKFIYDFTKGKLDRSLNSQMFTRIHTHDYQPKNVSFKYNSTQKIVSLQELNTYNFFSTVMQQDLVVIVMYYSTKCGFCTGISQILLETSKILSDMKDIKFTRIDGDSQALPWEFSMHHFPSILYFPPKRKSESRVFPQSVPITVPNLLAFILANVDSNIKLKMMWHICNQTKFIDDVQKCIKTVRNESMTLIGKILKLYRLNNDVHHRTLLLKQLENVQKLYFALSEKYLNNRHINKYINSLRNIDLTIKLRRETFL